MKKLTNSERLKQLKAIAALADDNIDLSDMPELSEEQLSHAVRGQMYRPIKKPVTIRLDADVIAWLKEDGRGYQTKANSLLRREMMRSIGSKKRPERASTATGSRSKRGGGAK